MFSLTDIFQLGTQSYFSSSLPVTKKPKRKSNKKKNKKGGGQKREIEAHETEEGKDDSSDSDEEVMTETPSTRQANNFSAEYEIQQIETHDEVTKMVHSLAAKYNVSTDFVGSCVNRMWENNQKYNDVDAVTKQLIHDMAHMQIERTTASSASSPVDKNDKNAFDESQFHEAQSGLADDEIPESVVISMPMELTEASTEFKEVQKSPKNIVRTQPSNTRKTEVPVNQPPVNPEDLSIIQRLNIAAEYSSTNLLDSLSALSSWAAVSSVHEIASSLQQTPAERIQQKMVEEEMREAERKGKARIFFQSDALELLLTTIFNDVQQMIVRKEVRTAFYGLLQSLLMLPSNDPGGYIYFITDSLDKLLGQMVSVRSAKSIPSMSEQNLAESSSMLAKHIGGCVRKLYFTLEEKDAASKQSKKSKKGTDGDKKGSEEQPEDAFTKGLQEVNKALDAMQMPSTDEILAAAEVKVDVSGAAAPEVNPSSEKIQNLFVARELQLDKLNLCAQHVTELSKMVSPGSDPASRLLGGTGFDSLKSELGLSIASNSSALESVLLSESDMPTDPLPTKFQQVQQMSTFIDRMCYERDSKIGNLTNELKQSTARMAELQAHRELLLKQLQICDQEVNNLNTRITAMDTSLAELQFFYQQQLDPVMQSSDKLRASLLVHEQVNNLLESIRTFEGSFAEALVAQQQLRDQQKKAAEDVLKESTDKNNGQSNGKVPKNGSNTTVITSTSGGIMIKEVGKGGEKNTEKDVLTARVLILSDALNSYVQTEADCVGFLSHRVKCGREKLPKLEREVQVFQSLSMKAMVTNLENAASKLSSEVNEDVQAIDHLQQHLADSLSGISSLNKTIFKDSRVSLPCVALAQIVELCREVDVTPAPDLVKLAALAPAMSSRAAPGTTARSSSSIVLGLNGSNGKSPVPATRTRTTNSSAPSGSGGKEKGLNVGKSTNGVATKSPSNSVTSGKTGKPSESKPAAAKTKNTKNNKKETTPIVPKVNTVNAIQMLEKLTSAPGQMSAAPVGKGKASAAALASKAPVSSVWKSSGGEGSKGLREIQMEQEQEINNQTKVEMKIETSAVDSNSAVVDGLKTPPGESKKEPQEPPSPLVEYHKTYPTDTTPLRDSTDSSTNNPMVSVNPEEQ